MTHSLAAGKWFVECLPADGGRISRLTYAGVELLTAPPTGAAAVAPPGSGAFEHRPVYGYDDCFPTVDACAFPPDRRALPDHGELVYLPWDVDVATGRMTCRVASRLLPARFTRELAFDGPRLTWRFAIANDGPADLPCLHVMHGLMPLHDVTALVFPAFREAVDENTDRPIGAGTPGELARHLLDAPVGYAKTLVLRGLASGETTVTFRGRVAVRMTQPIDVMPNAAIWWNKSAWPGRRGEGRSECAFEPLSGPCSSLSRSHASGRTMLVPGLGRMAWEVVWEALDV